jgi:predicted aldo/keto reductase-like oxidoreductase
MKKTNRRVFVKHISGLTLGMCLFPWSVRAREVTEYPMRVLGRTGEKVSILTMGGFHVGDPSIPDDVAIQIIRTSIDKGVNFMDNAWVYKDGRAETIMGRALKDGYRKKVLLMTKFMARTVEDAKKQLETSLRRFDLDSFDLMQFHSIGPEDVDTIYHDGLIEWAEEQRSQGVFRYIGFTGHTDPKAHIDMIERGYPWDTVQMPLNLGDYHRKVSYQKDVLPLAVEHNIGVIGMKSNGFGKLGEAGIAKPVEGLRYAMSLPVATVVSGIDSMEILEENLNMFHNFTPLTRKETKELQARSKGHSDIIEEHYRRNN